MLRDWMKRMGLLSALGLAACGGAQTSISTSEIYDRIAASSVEVLENGECVMSGFAVAPDRVLTASHGLDGNDERIEVRLMDGRQYPAQIEGVVAGDDLMLLRVELPEGVALETVPWTTKRPKPGSQAYLYGSPMRRHGLMFHGVVAAGRLSYEYFTKDQHYYRVLYLDASSPHGFSGGAWVDEEGRVFGLQMGMMKDAGLAYASPLLFLPQLMEGQPVCTPDLLFQFHESTYYSDDELDQERPPQFGIKLSDEAERILKKRWPQGQRLVDEVHWITAVDGKPVNCLQDLFDAAYAAVESQRMSIDVELWNSEQGAKLYVDWQLSCLEDRSGAPEHALWSKVSEEAARLTQEGAGNPLGAEQPGDALQKIENAGDLWARIKAEAARLAGDSGAQVQDVESKKADE